MLIFGFFVFLTIYFLLCLPFPNSLMSMVSVSFYFYALTKFENAGFSKEKKIFKIFENLQKSWKIL